MAAAPLHAIERGVDEAHVGDLELLCVDLEPGESTDGAIVDRQAAVTRRQSRIASFGAIAGMVTIVALVLGVLVPSLVPEGMGGWRMLGILLPIWASQAYAAAYRQRRLGGGSIKAPLVAGGIMTLATLATGLMIGRGALLTLAAIPLYVAMFAWIDDGLPFGWTRLTTGRRQVLRRRELDFTRLWLDEQGRLRLTLPSGRGLTPEDGNAVLRDLLDGYSWETSGEAQRTGYQLARGADPLPRLLEQLRPALMAEPEGLPLGRLPAAWRAALDLALAASTGTPGKLTTLAEKAREAQQVAAIAESLDDHGRLP